MNAGEFNEKYKNYLEEGHYGLDIHIPKVIEYLDKVFQGLILKEGFQYTQIKLKFNMARFYSNVSHELTFEIEENINKIVKIYDDGNN